MDVMIRAADHKDYDAVCMLYTQGTAFLICD